MTNHDGIGTVVLCIHRSWGLVLVKLSYEILAWIDFGYEFVFPLHSHS